MTKKWDKKKCSTITVKINDATVQSQIGLDSGTRFSETSDLVADTVYDEPGEKKDWCKTRGPIFLQEHDSRVQFKDVRINPKWLPKEDGAFAKDWQRETNCLSRD